MPEEELPGEEGKTYDWAGKKLSADELHAEAQKLVSEKSRLTNEKKSLEEAAALLKDPERLAAYYQEEFGIQEPDEVDLDAQEAAALDYLVPLMEKAGVVFNDPEYFKGAGLLTQDDAHSLKQEIKIDRIFDTLEENIDGSDGRPAFSRNEFARHLKENNVTWSGQLNQKTIAKIYEEMHHDALGPWRDAKKKEIDEEGKPVYTQRGGGGGRKTEPGKKVEITFDGDGDSLTPAQAVAKMVADGKFQ